MSSRVTVSFIILSIFNLNDWSFGLCCHVVMWQYILPHHYTASQPRRYPTTSLHGVTAQKVSYHITTWRHNPEGILPHHYTASQPRRYPTISLHGVTTQKVSYITWRHSPEGILPHHYMASQPRRYLTVSLHCVTTQKNTTFSSPRKFQISNPAVVNRFLRKVQKPPINNCATQFTPLVLVGQGLKDRKIPNISTESLRTGLEDHGIRDRNSVQQCETRRLFAFRE
jgi:hypothetical protein